MTDSSAPRVALQHRVVAIPQARRTARRIDEIVGKIVGDLVELDIRAEARSNRGDAARLDPTEAAVGGLVDTSSQRCRGCSEPVVAMVPARFRSPRKPASRSGWPPSQPRRSRP